MKKRAKKAISLILTVVFLLSLITTSIFGEETDSSYITEGDYQYTSNENFNKQLPDSFVFREDCFMRSSYLGCCHLAELSAQLAISSASWYGPNEDMYEVDASDFEHNTKDMLKEMGFENVSENAYCSMNPLTDSAACVVGMRTIKAFGKDYTLLAVVPRSAGYKQEWVGNFDVGTGGVHKGFKAARDEVLRFVKNYISENNITGDLKVWTAGHSRGAAVSNMLGGFFASAGDDYLGDAVSLKPEDVYCYTYATPRTIKDGASKEETFSVEGARGGIYEKDSPGEAWAYTKGGTVDIDAEEYGGVRNFPLPYDLITILPPPKWGFEYFGSVHNPEGCVTVDDMLNELSDISPYAHDRFLESGDHRNFQCKTFDLASLSIVPDANGSIDSMETSINRRLAGLMAPADTNVDYVTGGYQETLMAVAGLYGMLLPSFNGGIDLDVTEYIKPLLFSYLSYAKERLIEEGRATEDNEAVAIVLADFVQFATGEALTSESTVDDLLYILMKYITDHEGEPINDTAVTELASVIPEEYKSIISGALKIFYPNIDEDNPPPLEDVLRHYIKACVYGADPASEAGELDEYSDPADVRNTLYLLMNIAFYSMGYSELAMAISSGYGSIKDVVPPLMNLLLTEKDEEGNVIESYSTLDEGADGYTSKALDSLLGEVIENTKSIYGDYGEAYYNDVLGHFNTAKKDVRILRKLITYGLFYTEGEPYSAASSITNGLTFIGNVGIVPLAHYNEVYIAWARAVKNADCGNCDHYIEFIDSEESTCEKKGRKAHWVLHDVDGERYFTDRNLSEELTAAETEVDKLDHEPGDPVQENRVEPIKTKDGYYDEVVYCKICGEELSRKRITIPAEGEDSKPQPVKPDDSSPKDSKPDSNKAAPTGDSNMPAQWMVIFLASLGAVILTKRKISK
ncbi:MAG: hypothetical protein J6H21_06945 [Firmicutes bacterium]|nr:hypothetical protein [Bacillota bacterium]